MERSLIELLIFGLLAAGANVLGGLLLFPRGLKLHYRKLLKYLLALGAGFMLAVTFFEIIPKTLEMWTAPGKDVRESLEAPLLLILAGYLITQFFEHTIAPHLHLGGEMHCDEHQHEIVSARTAYTAVAGLLIHTFFDGVSIAAVATIDTRAGALVFLAVFLHKVPEGFTIGSMVTAAGRPFREVMYATSLVGVATLCGVLVFYAIGSRAETVVPYALPLAAGVTLYVAASDLIPEVNHHAGKNPLVSLSVFAGVGIFLALHALLGQLLGG